MKQRKIIIFNSVLIIILTIILLGILGPYIPIKKKIRYMCSVTGSSKYHIIYFGGLFTKEEYEKSPVKKWAEDNNYKLQHKWKGYGSTTDTIIGKWHSCGRPPPIYYFRPFQDIFIQKMTGKDIVKFIKIMEQESDDEQEKYMRKLTDSLFSEPL
ncbi:MAG: hypothetical protein GY795_46315 [Desulfobacterales bacterium]|nr:hypothetical protein [Desulfobacterales bacterium]